MKKLFIAVLAVAALASCAQDEIITKHNQVAIGFGNAYVDNATKAIITDAEGIKGFTVWGNVQSGTLASVALYGEDGAKVTRRTGDALGAAWDCDVVRYWTASCNYNFVAIANGTGTTVVNGLPTQISYEVNGDDPADLLYGVAAAETTDQNVISGSVTGTGNSIVAFSLSHLLSRVKVSFKSELAAEAADYRYTITDVKVVTPESGTYTIAGNTWELATTNAELPFTAGTSQIPNNSTVDYGAQLVIPTSQVDLVFTYALELKTGVDTWTPFKTGTVTKTGIVTPVKNYSYNITVKLQAGAKIDFTVAASGGLTDFAPDSNGDVNVQ